MEKSACLRFGNELRTACCSPLGSLNGNSSKRMKLETKRLKLREWRESDFASFAGYFANEESAKYLVGTKTPEEAWRLMAAYIGHYQLKGYSYMAVEEKATRQLVGSVGLWKSEPWPELELGYWLLSEMQRKGYATEAATAVRDYAFNTLKTDTLVSYIDAENEPSKKLAERLGAVYEGDIELLDFGLHCVYRYAGR